MMREQLLYYAVKYDGNYQKIKQAMEREEPWKKIEYDGNYVTIFDAQYPMKLRRLQYAPWVLFYEGNLFLAKNDGCGIIGSRNVTPYGREMCEKITRDVKKRYTIISGLAKGVDGLAHRCALDQHTIAVIGCGLDICYPKENAWLYQEIKEKHLLLSEYPKGSKPLAYHFPWRNRILAGLSDCLVVIEAKKRSGTLITVNEALAIDIPVYCVPHDYLREEGVGCNLLISQGANILVDEEDIHEI